MKITERGLTIAGISVVVLAFSAIVVAAVLAGGPSALQAPSIVGLLGFLGTLVGLFIAILKVDQTSSKVDQVQSDVSQVQDKVNGHLAQHTATPAGHTDEQIAAIVRQVLQALPSSPEAQVPPPPGAA